MFYIGSGRTGGDTVANLGLAYVPVAQLAPSAQVNNLFDRRYYWLGVRYSFGKQEGERLRANLHVTMR